MTKEDEKRIDEIDAQLISWYIERKQYILDGEEVRADALTEAMARLDRERSDIKEGIKDIMDERKKVLLDRLTFLNEEVENVGFFRRHKLFKELNETLDDLAEYRLRSYARGKAKQKTLDKQ